MKVLNLYAGLGGNRKLWGDVEVTAVEFDPKIAAAYQDQFPEDEVVIADAHQYLLENVAQFDFIWSSPPCQSHSKMVKFNRHKKPRYTDLKLYEQILLLQQWCESDWVVENVVPYYKPLIDPTVKSGRHLFWSSKTFEITPVKSPKDFINLGLSSQKEALANWLGIEYKKNLYYDGNHCPLQVLRNCVHPRVGEQILNQIMVEN